MFQLYLRQSLPYSPLKTFIFTWLLSWCGLNCSQSSGEDAREAHIGFSGDPQKPNIVSRIFSQLIFKATNFVTLLEKYSITYLLLLI